MTATYSLQDNTLKELPTMEKPKKPRRKDYDLTGAMISAAMLKYETELAAYRGHVSQRRTIPVHESARSLWKDGDRLEEGKDYEVRPVCIHTGGFEHADCVHPSCDKCAMTAFPLPVKSEADLPENSLILTAFQNEPVNFLLSNALRHLTQDQQMQLCNALRERLPAPASAEDEAARMYPEPTGKTKEMPYKDYEIVDKLREAHITCAGMYTDTIDKLKAEVVELKKEVFEWKSICHEHNLP